MANQRDDDVDPSKRPDDPPMPPKADGRAPSLDAAGKFLPDDSFLLDLDDELIADAAPTDSAGDEFLLVEDDAVGGAAATEPLATHAPNEDHATVASTAAAEEAPADALLADALPAETEFEPIEASSTEDAVLEEAAPAAADAADHAADDAALEPAAMRTGDAMEELAAVAAAALGQQFSDGRRKEQTPSMSPPAAPLVGAASGERAMAFSEPDSQAAPRPQVPSWLDRDESELPAFVGEEDDGAATASATALDSAKSSGTAAAPQAPIVELARPKRRFAAAAGMLLAAAWTAALAFELDRRGLLRPAVDGGEPIASRDDATTDATTDATPVAGSDGTGGAEEAEGGTGSDLPATVAPIDEPVASAEPIAEEPEPTEPVAIETRVDPLPTPDPQSAPPTEPPTEPTEPVVKSAPPDAVEAPRVPTPVAVERPREPAPGPAAVILEPPRKQLLPYGQPTARHSLEGSETIVQLENGHSFRGRIQRVRGSALTLKVGAGECVFDIGQISLLESTAPEFRREEEMPEASVVLHNGQRVRGRLMKQTRENVVLVVDNGQVVFPRAEVKDVSFTGRIHF